jgi:competence protein ComFC
MKQIKAFLVELLYPKRIKCCICGRGAREAVCGTCIASLEFIEGRVCLKCGKGLEDEYQKHFCPDCQREQKQFETAISCFQYEDMGKSIVHKLKYEGCKDIAKLLARLMKERLQDEGLAVDALVPVPIHPQKELARGYNQAYLMAEELAAAMGLPVWDCLERTKQTAEQFRLDKHGRILNVHNAFRAKMLYNIAYNRVLLVDDIYTTGSTANECSRVLKQMGVGRIYVITAATGRNT